MFVSVAHFIMSWESETKQTLKLLELLSDESLTQPEHKDVRNLGRVAWHIVTTIPEMLVQLGLKFEGPTEKDPIPQKASDIKDAYQKYADDVLNIVKKWQDEDMYKEDELYGETWKRGNTLWILMKHEVHHRGQMTILMRLAGLPMVGLYGPAREEWGNYGMETPEL